MGLSRTSNGHNGDWRHAQPAGRDWVHRPLVLAGLLVGLGFLWSKLTGHPARRPIWTAATAPDRPRKAHENRDVSPGWIFGIVLLLGASGIAVHFILAGFMSHLNKKRAPTDQWGPVAARVSETGKQAAFPLLQVSPPLDLEKFRAQEEQELNSYGWINQSAGVVHIPIRTAMDLLLKKGLPVRSAPGQARTDGSSLELMQQRVESQASEIGGSQ